MKRINSWILIFICAALSCGNLRAQNAIAAPLCTSTTWNGSTWSAGSPNNGTSAIFAGDYSSAGDLYACSVMVNSGAHVTFKQVGTSTTGHTLYVTNSVTVISGGTLTFKENAGLVQVNNVTNSGDIIYERDSKLGVKF